MSNCHLSKGSWLSISIITITSFFTVFSNNQSKCGKNIQMPSPITTYWYPDWAHPWKFAMVPIFKMPLTFDLFQNIINVFLQLFVICYEQGQTIFLFPFEIFWWVNASLVQNTKNRGNISNRFTYRRVTFVYFFTSCFSRQNCS